jgi:rubredoxin
LFLFSIAENLAILAGSRIKWYGLIGDENGDLRMKKYVCTVCAYVYDPAEGDPENNIDPGTAFEDLPEDWLCPVCSVGKDDFEPEDA